MANNLKQKSLFITLKKLGVTPVTYLKLYLVYCGTGNDEIYKTLDPKYLDGQKLSPKGLEIINEVDKLFIPQKKIDPRLSEPALTERLKKFNSIFPTGKIPNGKAARTTIPMLKKKFERFFKLYPYEWNIILKATMLYVNEYEVKRYDKMRTSGHFVIKTVEGETYCDLADYCEKVLDGEDSVAISNTTNFKPSHGKTF